MIEYLRRKRNTETMTSTKKYLVHATSHKRKRGCKRHLKPRSSSSTATKYFITCFPLPKHKFPWQEYCIYIYIYIYITRTAKMAYQHKVNCHVYMIFNTGIKWNLTNANWKSAKMIITIFKKMFLPHKGHIQQAIIWAFTNLRYYSRCACMCLCCYYVSSSMVGGEESKSSSTWPEFELCALIHGEIKL